MSSQSPARPAEMFPSPRRRSRLYKIVAVAGVLLFGLLLVQRHRTSGPHFVHNSDLRTGLSLQTSADLCRAHGFPSFTQHGAEKRKVYHLFLLSTELDMLEITLATLAKYVDYFVIVESPTTFTGLEKPLYLKDNWARFAAFHPQIIHRIVQDPGSAVLGSRTWDHEDFLRNALFDHVFPSLAGTAQEAALDDVLIVSDIDEIPKPATVDVLRRCAFPARLTLRSHFYYYSFQWRHRGDQWAHPQATVYRGLDDTILPKDLRNGEPATPGFLWRNLLRTWWDKAEIFDAAWHCSSCFSTVYEMKRKMDSFSHQGWNTEGNRDTKKIVQRVRDGLDLFGREGELYDRIDENKDLPQCILEQRQRFAYLVNRDGENAGFSDVMSSPPGGPAAADGGKL